MNQHKLASALKRIFPRPLADRLHKMRESDRLGEFAVSLGLHPGFPSEDRRILEGIILPFIARQAEYRHVLFVGCVWATSGYPRIFRGRDFWTLDIDPRKKRYGAAQHIVAPMQELTDWFRPGALDVVICNGVFGWGLDERGDVERAFEACFVCLRERGLLVVGWNDLPQFRPFPIGETRALGRFAPHVFAPFGAAHVRVENNFRHVFDFWEKPAAAAV